jgi:hypothetical protein
VTEGNKRENIRDELERAGESLRSADLLNESRLYTEFRKDAEELCSKIKRYLDQKGLITHEGS